MGASQGSLNDIAQTTKIPEDVELSPECYTLTVAQQTELTNLLWQVGGSSEFDKVEGQHGGLLGVVCTFRQKTVCLVFANLLLRTGFVVTIGPTNADETVVSGGAVKCVQRAIAQKRGEEIEQDLHYYARQSACEFGGQCLPISYTSPFRAAATGTKWRVLRLHRSDSFQLPGASERCRPPADSATSYVGGVFARLRSVCLGPCFTA